MRFLLDTHYAIELADRNSGGMNEADALEIAERRGELVISVVSLWEVAIKSRLGKLPLVVKPVDWPLMFNALGVPILSITGAHVLSDIGPEIKTSDPFDRLLLGVCAAENMRLLTVDRALINHPLAWREI
jgi:PIN domain nuclease of toxin-antitoxin system